MANHEERWRRLHLHEADHISGGHYSAHAYDTAVGEWQFLRSFEGLLPEDDAGPQPTTSALELITDYETLFEARITDTSHHSRLPSHDLELHHAHKSSSVDTQSIDILTSHTGDLLSLGSATYAELNRSESGGSIPIIAFSLGQSPSLLGLASLAQRQVRIERPDNESNSYGVACLGTGAPVVWFDLTVPILQICFASLSQASRTGRLCAVRTDHNIHVFQTRLSYDAQTHLVDTTNSNASKISKLPSLLEIPSSSTGGCELVDCAFSPKSQRCIAIIDSQGNWSIWQIQGRMHPTAKVTYRAMLHLFGKVFTWEFHKRPSEHGVYFDGWHKVLWTSDNRHDVNRLVTCNRQVVQIWDLEGNEIGRIDPRLRLGNRTNFILDIRNLRSSIIVVLTTTRVLIFDTATKDWKDHARETSTAMICAIDHNHSPQDHSLKMTMVDFGSSIFISLYTSTSSNATAFDLRLELTGSEYHATVLDAINIPLPRCSSPIRTLAIASLQHTAADTKQAPINLCQISILYKDSVVRSAVAEWRTSAVVADEADHAPIIKLPDHMVKSARNVEERDDLLDFVVDDDHPKTVRSLQNLGRALQSRDLRPPSNGTAPDTYLRQGLERVHEQLTLEMTRDSGASSIPNTVEEFFEMLKISNESFTADTFTHLLSDAYRVNDIDHDSANIEKLFRDLQSDHNDLAQITLDPSSPPSILEQYEILFKNYIETLDTKIPIPARIQRERLIRDLALDLHLSSQLVVPVLSAESASQAQDQHQQQPVNQRAAPIGILSDPLQPPNLIPLASSPEPRISATQAQAQPDAPPSSQIAPEPSSKPSSDPVQNVITRLSRFTTIAKPPLPSPSLPPASTSIDPLASILTHLPASPTTSPSAYSYTATEFQLSLSRHTNQPSDKSSAAAKALRRRERAARKIARVRETNLERERAPVVGTGRRDEEQRDRPRGGEIMTQMPIRNVQSSQGGLVGSSQSQGVGAGLGGISMTQPERGVFGGTSREGPVRKKVKRTKGF